MDGGPPPERRAANVPDRPSRPGGLLRSSFAGCRRQGGGAVREKLQFRVLGPLEVLVGGVVVPVNATKQRILLAMLLLSANSLVSADDLVDQLWGQDPPRGARATLQTYVQRLRRVIGEADRIITMTGGYRIRIEPGELDVDRFRELVER